MSEPSIRIALVDDDDSVRTALGRLLSALCFDVTTYGSAHEFITSLKSGPPDCLVADLHMPGITGLELLRHLMRVGIKIPTIVVTAHDEPGIRERCLSAGASAVLLKPIESSSLISAINTATNETTSDR
jgi:FixJ family two-component response regulator